MSLSQYNALKAQNDNFINENSKLCLEKDLTAVALLGLSPVHSVRIQYLDFLYDKDQDGSENGLKDDQNVTIKCETGAQKLEESLLFQKSTKRSILPLS